MDIDDKIFKAYDVRGIYPIELNEETAYRIGRAFVTFLGCEDVVIGRDMRTSSPQMFESLTKGITDQGANVIDIGISSTPYFYFEAAKHSAGIMITASHNPAKYNGFKFCRNNAIPISGDTGIKNIRDLCIKNEFIDVEKKGHITQLDIMEKFIEHNLKFINKSVEDKPLKIVIDTANGMGGFSFPKVFEKTNNIEVIPLYFDIDMSFPNHEANPLDLTTVVDLQKKVIETNADFGVAIDGDADRCMFIDEKGNYISADLTTALLSEEILKKHPNASILYDLRSSWIIKKAILENNGKAIMCRVGSALIKEQMRSEDAAFAGELSGHFYYKDSFFTESSIISIFLMINKIREANKSLSELVEPLKIYFASGEINSEVKDVNAKMSELVKLFKDKSVSFTDLDGIKFEFDDWWFNVRVSNTEPLLRLNLEAKTQEKMVKMRDEILNIIRS